MKRSLLEKLPYAVMATGTLVLSGIAATPMTAQAATASSSVTIPIPAMSTLDPTQWNYQDLLSQGTILEGLYGYNQKNQIVPKIATGYKTSEGGKVWTIFLRKNAKWSNGKPVTAQDFYNAWMYVASPKNTASALWASVMTNVLNAWTYHGGGVPASKVGLKVINPYEIQLTLNSPANILGNLVLSESMPMYMPVVNAHPANWFMPQYFVGDGPYVVKSFVPNGNITLARNPNYVGAPGQTNVGNVQTINIVPTPTVPVQDYVAGKLDAAYILNPADYKYAESQPSLKSQLHKTPIDEMYYMAWDKSVDPSPLDNQKVRQAIAMVINRSELANAVLNGMGGPTSTFGVPGWPTNKNETGLPYNVKKAQALLAQAGYPGGKGFPTLTIYTRTQANDVNDLDIGEAIQAELKQALGINFQIDSLPDTTWDDVVYGGLYPGIKPGYVISIGQVNNMSPWFLTFQAIQWIPDMGTIGPVSLRQHVSNWYFPKYDPASVKKYGNPDDTKLGVSWSNWIPLQRAVIGDSKILTAWLKKQPQWYQQMKSSGTNYMQTFNGYVAQWRAAKTNVNKHNAWVSAWKFVGNYSAGNGDANIGLDGQVYTDQHMPAEQVKWMLDSNRLNEIVNYNVGAKLAASVDSQMMNAGYVEPLVYMNGVYLEKPTVIGVQANPWSFFNFYQLQYISTK